MRTAFHFFAREPSKKQLKQLTLDFSIYLGTCASSGHCITILYATIFPHIQVASVLVVGADANSTLLARQNHIVTSCDLHVYISRHAKEIPALQDSPVLDTRCSQVSVILVQCNGHSTCKGNAFVCWPKKAVKPQAQAFWWHFHRSAASVYSEHTATKSAETNLLAFWRCCYVVVLHTASANIACVNTIQYTILRILCVIPPHIIWYPYSQDDCEDSFRTRVPVMPKSNRVISSI